MEVFGGAVLTWKRSLLLAVLGVALAAPARPQTLGRGRDVWIRERRRRHLLARRIQAERVHAVGRLPHGEGDAAAHDVRLDVDDAGAGRADASRRRRPAEDAGLQGAHQLHDGRRVVHLLGGLLHRRHLRRHRRLLDQSRSRWRPSSRLRRTRTRRCSAGTPGWTESSASPRTSASSCASRTTTCSRTPAGTS